MTIYMHSALSKQVRPQKYTCITLHKHMKRSANHDALTYMTGNHTFSYLHPSNEVSNMQMLLYLQYLHAVL